MKKNRLLYIILCAICFLSLAACKGVDNEADSDFIADNRHCVLSLPEDYNIFYDNAETYPISMFDENLYNAKTVNGNPKKDGFRYYNVLKNEPFRILTPISIIQTQNANGQTLVYWKLNDTLYKDGDNYNSTHTFTCNVDTEITPVYYEFRPVGILLYEVAENDMPIVQDDEIFDNDGNIKEQAGIHYLYGVYDFEPYQNYWRTDLTLNKFEITYTAKMYAENYSKKYYTLNIEIEADNIFANGKIIVETLYKIYGHGYMTYGSLHVINENVKDIIHTLSIGDHEIKFSFA